MKTYNERRVAVFDSYKPELARLIGDGAGGTGIGTNDSGEAMAFLVSQLAHTESQIFERMRQPMQYAQFIPVSHEAGEYADSIRYELYDMAGRGKRTSGKGKSINLVDVAYADKSFPVMNGDIGYDYSQEELRRSAFLRRPLNERRMAAAVEGYERHMNDVGLFGEASGGITGLFNNAFIPVANAPTGLWTGGVTTVDEILADINAGIFNVWSNTAYNDTVTDIILPPSCLNKIATTARSSTSDTTILKYIKDNNIAKQQKNIDINFVAGFGLETAGAGATKRALFYVKNPQRLVMHIPLPLRFLAPQFNGLAVEVPGEYKYSGVEVRYPKSAYYMDNL